MREIHFFRTANGRAPVEEFILSLPSKQRDKIVTVLEVIELAEAVPAHLLKKLAGTGGLWEVRVQHAGDAFRLLGFLDNPRLVILVSAFAKKTQKLPRSEIQLAQARRREYEGRKKG